MHLIVSQQNKSACSRVKLPYFVIYNSNIILLKVNKTGSCSQLYGQRVVLFEQGTDIDVIIYAKVSKAYPSRTEDGRTIQ